MCFLSGGLYCKKMRIKKFSGMNNRIPIYKHIYALVQNRCEANRLTIMIPLPTNLIGSGIEKPFWLVLPLAQK